jgi:glycosyltransferase involved in cell wall biosynthesis
VTRQIIIDASILADRPSGIGMYALELLREWAVRPGNFEFKVYIHESAKPLLDGIVSERFSVRAVPARWIPRDANFRRFLFVNLLAASERRTIIFHASQFEATFTGRRQIVTVHDLIPLQESTTGTQHLFFRSILPRCLRTASMVITPSETSADVLRSRFLIPASKIRVIPHGVRRFPSEGMSVKPSRPYILFAGRLTPYRNLDRLVSAFQRIEGRIEHDLIIAGEPAPGYTPPPTHPRVRFAGYVDDDSLGALYRGASLFVFPSNREGFGFPPLEAMLCGTPVVTSRESCLPEVCGSAAWFVDPRSVESIADGLLRVLLDENLQATLRDAGLRRANELTWRASAERHLQVFEEVSQAG